MNTALNIILNLKDYASSGVKKVQSGLAGFSQSANIAQTRAQELQLRLSGVGAIGRTVSVGAGIVAGAIGFLGKSALSAAGQYEQNRIAFKGLLGTYEEADRVLTRIVKVASETPFETASLTSMTQQLTTITKDGNKAIDVLVSVGDAISKSGKGVVEMERVVLNLQQVASTGKVTELDIREFQRAIPLFNDIIASAGITTDQLKESKNASELLFGAFRKAAEEGGIAFGGLAEQAKSFNGRTSTLKDNLGIFIRQIGDTLLPVAKPFIDFLIAMTNGFSKLSPVTKTVIASIGGLVFIVASLATGLGALAWILPTISAGLALIGVSVKGLMVGTGIGALVVAVGSLTYAMYQNWNQIKSWGSGIASFFVGGAKAVLESIDTLIKKFNEFAKKIPLMPKINIDVSGSIKNLDELQKKMNTISNTKPNVAGSSSTQKSTTVSNTVVTADLSQSTKAEEKAKKEREKIRKNELDEIFANQNKEIAMRKTKLDINLAQEREMISNRLKLEGLDEQQRAEIRNRLNQLDIDIAVQKQERDQSMWSEEQAIMFEREKLKNNGISTDLQITKIVLDSARKAGNEKLSIEKQIANGMLDYAKKGIIAEVDAWASKEALIAGGRIASSLGTDVGAWGLLAIATGASAGIRSAMDGIQLAEGGIVMPQAGGVRATIAEAGSAEAVIPLDSTQGQKILGGGDEQRVIILDNDGMTTLAKGVSKKIDYLRKTGQLGSGL